MKARERSRTLVKARLVYRNKRKPEKKSKRVRRVPGEHERRRVWVKVFAPVVAW